MATRISTGATTGRLKAAADHVVDLLDAGSAAGYIEVRTGSQPATVGTAATGTLLGTLALSDPAFGDATDASPSVATANAITDDSSADASGTAGWFRAYDSDDNPVLDGSVSESGGGGEAILDETDIVAGGTISITSWTYTQA